MTEAEIERNEGFWRDKRLTADEKNALLVETLGRVYGTVEGKIALNVLLVDLGFFMAADDEGARALNNYAKFFIRERLGVRDTKLLTDFIAETAVFGGGR